MKRFLAAIGPWLAASPALSEVCDKVSESWSPGDPPVDSLLGSRTIITVLVMLAGLAIALGLKSKLLATFGSAAGLLLVAFEFADRAERDDVFQMAVREGCLSESSNVSLVLATLWVLAFGMMWLMLSRRRARHAQG